MSWFLAAIYDPYMRSCERAGLSAWRNALLGDVAGEVLEIGAGTGVNLQHYGPDVERLVLVEPDPHMRRRLQERVRQEDTYEAQVRDWDAHALEAEDASFDWVVCTLVLCSVDDPHRSLAEIRRVLRPGGKLAFLEHVAAPRDRARYRWQRRLEPLWKRAVGNCHLTRDTEQVLVEAGFELEQIERESMRKALPILRPTVRGIAVAR